MYNNILFIISAYQLCCLHFDIVIIAVDYRLLYSIFNLITINKTLELLSPALTGIMLQALQFGISETNFPQGQYSVP